MLGAEPSLAIWAFCYLALYLLTSSALLCVFEETSYFPETQPYFHPQKQSLSYPPHVSSPPQHYPYYPEPRDCRGIEKMSGDRPRFNHSSTTYLTKSTSPSLSFPVWKMGLIIISFSRDRGEN